MSEEMNISFIDALDELADVKNISKESLKGMIEKALLSAYKQKYGSNQNVRVVIDEDEGELKVLASKEVVEEVDDERLEVSLDDAKAISPSYEIGDYIDYKIVPAGFGRVAAKTAKQVLTQDIVEEERHMIMDEFSDRIGEMMSGTIQRRNGKTVYLDLGSAEGVLPYAQQVPGEFYAIDQIIRVYVSGLSPKSKNPQIMVSRKAPELVERLFELEVPEVKDGIVEIKGLARDAGSRTKMAVYSEDQNVDPVGACVGPRGSRVQKVVDELNGEKIDIVFWSEDPVELISNVLSPAEVEAVIILDEEKRDSIVIVPDDQLSLAIGKKGQNVSLAAKVSRWSIDIKSHSAYNEEVEAEESGEVKSDEDEEAAMTDDAVAEDASAEEPAEGSEDGDEKDDTSDAEVETGEESETESGAVSEDETEADEEPDEQVADEEKEPDEDPEGQEAEDVTESEDVEWAEGSEQAVNEPEGDDRDAQ